MIELFPNLFYIPGKNRSRFPYCACLYIRGRNLRVLIDAGMGREHLTPIVHQGLDLVILTHSHIDHRLTRIEIPTVPVWCHDKELPYLKSREIYLEGTGMGRSGVQLGRLFDSLPGVFQIEIDKTVADGDKIDTGDITLEVIHTPGHTPGHISIHVPEYNFLFTGDVDLTSFGPFYGHDFADIDQFLASINRLAGIGASSCATGHAGPFDSGLEERFVRYRSVVDERDKRILNAIGRPVQIGDLLNRKIIYPSYPDDGGLTHWFEKIHLYKHVKRLAKRGDLIQGPDGWSRA